MDQRIQQSSEDSFPAQAQSSDSLFQAQPVSKPERIRRKPARAALEPLTIILVIALIVLLRVYVYESDIVQGVSMLPSLRSGDYLLVNKMAFRKHSPKRFDIVTFPSPDEPRDILIKRVIGLAGEWVQVWGTKVYVNGRLLREPYARWRSPSFGEPVRVPPDHIYVMGDNRDNSEDSREWGPVDMRSLRGRAVAAYFPVDRAQVLR